MTNAGSQLTIMTQHEKVMIFRDLRGVTTDLLDVSILYLCLGHQRIDANPLWWVVHSNSGQSTPGDHSGKIWGILVARGGSAMLVLRSESPIFTRLHN